MEQTQISNLGPFSTTSGLISRIPVEIWEMIFHNLEHSQDIIHVSKTCLSWESILSTSKQEWLFGKAFEHIFVYLSKNEMLKCRLICKRWHFAVNYLLENNFYHRPASGENIEYKTDHYHYSLFKITKFKQILYNFLRFKKMLDEHSSNRNPLIGKSAEICLNNPPGMHNLEFLEKFGHHIHFLHTQVYANPKTPELIKMTLEALLKVPNLKYLHLQLSGSKPEYRSVHHYYQQEFSELANIVKSTFLQETLKNGLPKLETLVIHCWSLVEIHQIIFSLLDKRNLESLYLWRVRLPPNIKLEKLKSLTICTETENQLKRVRDLNAMGLRMLHFKLSNCNENTELLFEVANSYAQSLRNFGLRMCSRTFQPFHFKTAPMKQSGILKLPFVKTLVIDVYSPSLNFCCGLKSVEYLHVYVNRQWDLSFQCFKFVGANDIKEILDLTKYINKDWHNHLADEQYSFENKLKVYQSNVWEVFPRLKVLTVYAGGNGPPYYNVRGKFWRNFHEKL